MTDREHLAAELALRLLSDEEQAAARAQLAGDPELAAMVADWEAKTAPLADALDPVEPSPQLWARIAASLGDPADAPDDPDDYAPATSNVAANDNAAAETAALRQALRRWQLGTLAAAAAALVLGYLGALNLQRPVDAPISTAAPQLLVADLPVGGASGPRLALTYLPQSHDLVIEASNVPGDGVHDHELWLVVPQGKPVSMGIIASGQQRRIVLPPALAGQVAAGLGVVLTREPLGGAPKGGDAGPVVATGKFSII